MAFQERFSSCRQLLKHLAGVWAGLFGATPPGVDPLSRPHPLRFWGLVRAVERRWQAADVSALWLRSSTCRSES